MTAALTRRWVALVLGAVALSTGCLTVTPSAESGMLLDRDSRASAGLPEALRGDAQGALTGSTAPFTRWAGDGHHPPESRRDPGEELGVAPENSSSDENRIINQAMMLAIAVKELLYGLETLLKGSQSEHNFIGVDSSFSVWLKKTNRGRVSVRCGKAELGEAELKEFCQSTLQSVETFFTLSGNELPTNDPVREDLLYSIQSLKRCLYEK